MKFKVLLPDILWSCLPPLAGFLVALAGGIHYAPFPDCGDYLVLAETLRNTGQFDCPAAVPDGWRAPGVPMLLALFGSYLWLNLLSAWGITFLILRLANYFRLRYRRFVVFFLGGSAGFLACTAVPLSEIPFLFFFSLMLFLIARDRPAGAGLSLAAASCCRPAAMFFFIPATLFLLWQWRHALTRRRWLALLWFVLAANSLPLAWSWRNYLHYGHFEFSSHGGYYLLFYKAGSYLSVRDGRPFDQVRRELDARLPAEPDTFLRSRLAGQLGRQLILENLSGFLRWLPCNLIDFFQPDITPLLERLQIAAGNRGTLDILRRQGLFAAIRHYFAGNLPATVLTVLYLPWYGLLWLLTGYGFWRLCRQKQWTLVIAVLLSCGYFMLLPLGNLDWRFRLPLLPLGCLLALYGINQLPRPLKLPETARTKVDNSALQH